jgi:hypothetical protein
MRRVGSREHDLFGEVWVFERRLARERPDALLSALV